MCSIAVFNTNTSMFHKNHTTHVMAAPGCPAEIVGTSYQGTLREVKVPGKLLNQWVLFTSTSAVLNQANIKKRETVTLGKKENHRFTYTKCSIISTTEG